MKTPTGGSKKKPTIVKPAIGRGGGNVKAGKTGTAKKPHRGRYVK